MVANLSRDCISSEDCFWSHSQCYKINSTNQGAWEEGVFPSLLFQCPVFLTEFLHLLVIWLISREV